MGFEKAYQPSVEEQQEWNDCSDQDARALQEYEQYVKERGDLCKAETDAEKNFDTLLVTISSVAIAASFTLMKDVIKGTNGWIVLAWFSLVLCLIGSITDRLYTYQFHKKWRLSLDDVFRNYRDHCGHAWKEAHARLDKMRRHRVLGLFPAEKSMDVIKWVNFATLIFGIVFLAIFVYTGVESASSQQPPPAMSSVARNATSTQPTMQASSDQTTTQPSTQPSLRLP